MITYDNQDTIFEDGHCLQNLSKKDTYLLLGDSHAAALWDGLRTSLPNSNVVLAATWGCPPSLPPEMHQQHLGEVGGLCEHI